MIADVALVARAAEALRLLDDLCGWPFVGERAEAVRAALRGETGATAAEVDRLADLADRWSTLRPDLRAFYRALAPVNASADLALRRVLLGDPTPLPGWRLGVLREAWTLATGFAPSIDLVPAARRPTGGW